MVENKAWHCGENMDSEADKVYSNSSSSPRSLPDLRTVFNLNSSRISFEHRRVTFGLSSSDGVFPTNRNMKIPGIP